jgi:hypothetical protein
VVDMTWTNDLERLPNVAPAERGRLSACAAERRPR